MPASWTSSGGGGLSAGEYGIQAKPALQPSFYPLGAAPRSAVGPSFGGANAQFATDTTPGRPYADVGKLSGSITDIGEAAKNATKTQGFLEGFGSGVGRLLGGAIGTPFGHGQDWGQAGANVGQAVGSVAQLPVAAAGAAIGGIASLPASPILPGYQGGFPGQTLASLTDAERAKVLAPFQSQLQQAQSNPLMMRDLVGQLDKAAFQYKVDAGQQSALLHPAAPTATLGDQVMALMGGLGLGSQVIERGAAGGPLDAIGRVMRTQDSQLSPEVQALKAQYTAGTLNHDQFLDQLTMAGAGYSNDWWANLPFEMLLDPTNLMFGAGETIGLASKSARAAEGLKFVRTIGPEATDQLAKSAAEKIAQDTGRVVPLAEVKADPAAIAAEAKATGQYSRELGIVQSTLTASQKLALHPAAQSMERVANFANSIIDPMSAIGKRGTEYVGNAYRSSEATKGMAQAIGMGNWSHTESEFARIGKSDLFDRSMGYATSQEQVLLAGEGMASDAMRAGRVVDARPTDVARARADVGTKKLASQMEGWVRSRMTDLAKLSGGTTEEAMVRARAFATDRLTRMGLTADEAAGVVKGLDRDGLSGIDLMYFGHKIEGFNQTVRTYRDFLASKEASGTLTQEEAALKNTVDRLTLIGPRELTTQRAEALRGLIDQYEKGGLADASQIRDAIRQYDLLSDNMLADAGTDAEKVAEVRRWLDEFEKSGLTTEADVSKFEGMPESIVKEADRGDGYVYGLRPGGADGSGTIPEWRVGLDENGRVVRAKPWIDIVGDKAQPWSLRFKEDPNVIKNLPNAIERSLRFMSNQITTDKIDREALRAFRDQTMPKFRTRAEGYGPGLSYNEATDLYKAVQKRALEASTAPRGLSLKEFESVIKRTDAGKAAQRVGMSGRDLQLATFHAMVGDVGTVGVTQKISGLAKAAPGIGRPLGGMAERAYPLIRFGYNPFFQLQEWVEPWIFSWARGVRASKHGIEMFDPVTGTTRAIPHDEIDAVQLHLMDRYRAGNPEAEFDTMERGLSYLWGQKAARDAAAATDQSLLSRGVSMVGMPSAHSRKAIAQSQMFRYFFGPMLKEQFDHINPGVWRELEQHYQTTDVGAVALKWAEEKDLWATADPKVAFHLLDAGKSRRFGALAAISPVDNATHIFETTPAALIEQAKSGALTQEMFKERMLAAGADPHYADRSWAHLMFDAKTGGIEQYWKDALPFAKGGQEEIAAIRKLVQNMAGSQGPYGISETELLSRTMRQSPVWLLHEDLINATPAELDAWDVMLQQNERMARYYKMDPITGGVTVNPLFQHEAEAELRTAAATPPTHFVEAGLTGNSHDMQAVQFGPTGRSLLVPGGEAALRDVETPWTSWEAHLLRSQVINPNDLHDPALADALYQKMWRGHTIDQTDPANIYRTYNNYAMAATSGGTNLTRNEFISTRLRAVGPEGLDNLAAYSRSLAADIERDTGHAPDASELGMAYASAPDLGNYIPLDSRFDYYPSLLGERPGLVKAGPEPTTVREAIRAGKQEWVNGTLPATQPIVEGRAQIAQRYLEQTGRETRALHRRLEKGKFPTGEIKKGKPVMRSGGGPLLNWGVDQVVGALRGHQFPFIDTLDGATIGLKRAAQFDGPARERIIELAGALAENPEDVKARWEMQDLLGLRPLKDADENVAFTPFNVHGAGGLSAGKSPTGTVIGHGDKELFAYLKNPDVAWRSAGTNEAMGRMLQMAQDMSDNPEFYVRRQTPAIEAARFGRDARGNAVVPTQFRSEPGYVYRTVNRRRVANDWRVGEFAAKHPATIYATGDDSVVLRAAHDTDWEDAVGGVDASKNVTSKTAVPADRVEMLGADGTWHPVTTVQGGLEPLDQFGERIAQRTPGLSLKTGYFGQGLGDPLNLRMGVHDTHMVGEAVEWEYARGGQGWKDFYESLSPGMKTQVNSWIEKDRPAGAGVFKWPEAQGADIPLKAPKTPIEGVAAQANYVRGQIDKAVKAGKITEAHRARFFQMYRNDDELAQLYGRNIQTLGGDYQVFEDSMSRRRAIDSVADPTLGTHGNMGFQWKLWDRRRNQWDPETTAFGTSHDMPRLPFRFLASSDDGHSAAGFHQVEPRGSVLDREGAPGQPPTYLDPNGTILNQMATTKNGQRVIRGATIPLDTGEKIVGFTQYRNRTTFLHELTHAVIEPLLDESGRNVVLDDFNAKVVARNAQIVTGGARYENAKALVAELAPKVDDATTVATVAAQHHAKVIGEAADAAKLADSYDRAVLNLTKAAGTAEGTLSTLQKGAPAARKAINAMDIYPSDKARRLTALDRRLSEAQTRLTEVTAQREEAVAAQKPARDAAEAADREVKEMEGVVGRANAELDALLKQHAAALDDFTGVATRAQEATKASWDRDVSEHLADEFQRWLATGKASSPQMRDVFAYFRDVLRKVIDWAHGQPGDPVSPEVQRLFEDLTTPKTMEQIAAASAVPWNKTEEMMHAAGVHAVVNGEDAAHTNVQFRRNRSWLERSVNHPYMGIYPSSYMWGKVMPEVARGLAHNPFGLPIPILTKPVRIGSYGEFGLHGTPYWGFLNAMRAQNSVQLQQSTDPGFAAQMNDPKNQKVFQMMNMLLPATPWDAPANFPLIGRRVAEWGLSAQDAEAAGQKTPAFDVAGVTSDTLSYAFGLPNSIKRVQDVNPLRWLSAPILGGDQTAQIAAFTPGSLAVAPEGTPTLQQSLQGAQQQLQAQLPPGPPPLGQ